MTLQDRQSNARKEVDSLLQERQQLQARTNQVQARLVGLDAELALLESLITEGEANTTLKKKLKAVK